jgi:hypothetical protein
MENTQIPTEPPPLKPMDDLSSVLNATSDIPPKRNGGKKFIIPIVFLALIAAIVVPAVMKTQTITGEAAGEKCMPITKVMINPGQINTYTNYPPTNLSVLAYDYYNKPVWQGVQYEWGMSSTRGIGTVKARHDLATFIPSRPGTGDLYVKTKNKCTTKPVIGSIRVDVKLGILTTPPVKPKQ